jgi:surface polysaccharide O-acyltransferase-like enzyme
MVDGCFAIIRLTPTVATTTGTLDASRAYIPIWNVLVKWLIFHLIGILCATSILHTKALVTVAAHLSSILIVFNYIDII